MSQMVFLGGDGNTLHLPFRAGRWTVERIKELLKDRGVSPDQIVAFANSENENAEMKALTDELIPNGKELEVSPLADGAEIEGEMKAQMTERYVRAIAKIGFHSFLKFFPQFSGLEAEFDEIKRFIYKGEAKRQMVERTDEPFLRDLQQGARILNWCHLVATEYGQMGIVARIQFFVGPTVRPFVWTVLIDPRPRNDAGATGAAFVYFDDVTDGYDGAKVELKAI